MNQSLLSWRKYRYLWWALGLSAVSIAVYVSQWSSQLQPANGGTWQGYTLGTVGALLIVWLSFLGIRKRSYKSSLGRVQGWASAHVYLGSALLVVGSLHCAFQFGWNVHTLAYVLMCIVIVSGFYGLYVYMHLPSRMADNRSERNRDLWLKELGELNKEIRNTSERCDAELQTMVMSAVDLTRVGGGMFKQLSSSDRSMIKVAGDTKPRANKNQTEIIDALSKRIPNARKTDEAEVLNDLLSLFGRRQVVLQVLRRDIQLNALLKVWLLFHVPLSMALLMALLIHIFSVFIYW